MPEQSSASITPTTTSAPGSRGVFSGMNACTALDSLVAGKAFEPGENKTSRNECHAAGKDMAVGLALDPGQGLRAFNENEPNSTSTNINGRKALRASTDHGECDIAIEVGPSERAVVFVTLYDPDADACPAARQYAEKLEPELPTVG